MIVDILDGIGRSPLRLPASLVIVRLDDGTPIMVSGAFGPEGAVRSSHALEKDFNQTLRALGVTQEVICDRIELPPPPPGARLILAPRS